MKKKSSWLKGLQHAERIGIAAAMDNIMRREYQDTDNNDFERGVVDYVRHHEQTLKPMRKSA